MSETGLDDRYRGKNGAIASNHGHTLVRTLRKAYGVSFGRGCSENSTLSEVLHRLDVPSLSALIRDHGAGSLWKILSRAERKLGLS